MRKQLLCSNVFVLLLSCHNIIKCARELRNFVNESMCVRCFFFLFQKPIYTIYWVFNLHCYYGRINLRSTPERIVIMRVLLLGNKINKQFIPFQMSLFIQLYHSGSGGILVGQLYLGHWRSPNYTFARKYYMLYFALRSYLSVWYQFFGWKF